MNRTDAAALITTYTAPEGMLPIGSVVAYEDTCNAYRRATVIGYSVGRFGTTAIVERERWTNEEPEEFATVSADTIANAPHDRGLAGWSIVLDLR